MKKGQTFYTMGQYTVVFYPDDPISKTPFWSWQLFYKGESLADSANDLYKSLSNAKRGFRSARKAMLGFMI